MSKATGMLQKFIDWLWEALERAQQHDRDRFVDYAHNPREVSQRIHRLEHESGGL